MCLATVYVESDGQKREVMRDVAWINPESHGLRLTTLIGESRMFQAQIRSIDLMSGSIVLHETTADSLSQSSPQAGAPRSEGQTLKGERSVSWTSAKRRE